MTLNQKPKRLIDVAFPLRDVSLDARKDKYRSAPHPQTIHPWWARRPLPACRAFIYASLVDDPGEGKERDQLLQEVGELSQWNAIRRPDKIVRSKDEGGTGLTGHELLTRARERILRDNDHNPPTLADPFAGGGAIPLEGLRLGCKVEASDLNPVATLILKSTVQYPQQFGRPNDRSAPHYILESPPSGLSKGIFDSDIEAAYESNPSCR